METVQQLQGVVDEDFLARDSHLGCRDLFFPVDCDSAQALHVGEACARERQRRAPLPLGRRALARSAYGPFPFLLLAESVAGGRAGGAGKGGAVLVVAVHAKLEKLIFNMVYAHVGQPPGAGAKGAQNRCAGRVVESNVENC